MIKNGILIADSGSTGCQWAMVETASGLPSDSTQPPQCEQEFPVLKTTGLNPKTTDDATLHHVINELKHRLPPTWYPHTIFFYGAGCGTVQSRQRIHNMLTTLFPSAQVVIEGDLLGACRAVCTDHAGLVGILGTGSNACYYDGCLIERQGCSLGYLLGDEGSGNHIGKLLLKAYLTHSLPTALHSEFQQQYHLSETAIIDQLYCTPRVNRFLASFAPFAAQYQEDPFIRTLLHQSFSAYFSQQIEPLHAPTHDLYMVGSIASAFRHSLSQVAISHGFNIIAILKEPIQPLAKYHLLKEYRTHFSHT